MHDAEMIAQELSALGHKLDDLEKRLAAVEKVNTRLEEAALNHSARSRGDLRSLGRPLRGYAPQGRVAKGR
jgi:hypothetical protein